jgi:putative NIF3 family GTP cyclohydrolase 1 type 2
MQQHNNKYPADMQDIGIRRRDFIAGFSKALGGAALLSTPAIALAMPVFPADAAVTVGDIMDMFIKQVPGAPFSNTVDTLKAGTRDIKVTGVITTMFATIEVIQKAIELGANFIIAHEPTFYNHTDDVTWLQQDDVYAYKANLLKQHNIAVWRNHDYVHSLSADGVYSGVLAQLGWQQYDTHNNMLTLPATSLQQLIQHAKNKMGIKELRYIGNLQQSCSRILLMPGAAGGRRQIEAISKNKPDVLICGEIQEWETAEYVRDARAKGTALALVVLGHIASEEPGSAFMATWVKKNVPGMTVTHVPAGNSLSFA